MAVKNYQQQNPNATALVCNSNGDQWNFKKLKNQTVLNASVIGSEVMSLKTDKGIVTVEYIWID
jgi:hypothetical protein